MLINALAGTDETPELFTEDRRQWSRRSADLKREGTRLIRRMALIAIFTFIVGYAAGKGWFEITPETPGVPEVIHVQK